MYGLELCTYTNGLNSMHTTELLKNIYSYFVRFYINVEFLYLLPSPCIFCLLMVNSHLLDRGQPWIFSWLLVSHWFCIDYSCRVMMLCREVRVWHVTHIMFLVSFTQIDTIKLWLPKYKPKLTFYFSIIFITICLIHKLVN